MAIKEWLVYEARCDRCGEPHEDAGEYLSEEEALTAASHDGWLRQGDAIYCRACVVFADATYPPTCT